jgi:hypothetical protein
MKSTRELDECERRELYETYINLQECVYTIEHLIRGTRGYDAAKAYWFASLSLGINEERYNAGGNPTMETYLLANGIMDENGDFIEEEDCEDDDEDEGE